MSIRDLPWRLPEWPVRGCRTLALSEWDGWQLVDSLGSLLATVYRPAALELPDGAAVSLPEHRIARGAANLLSWSWDVGELWASAWPSRTNARILPRLSWDDAEALPFLIVRSGAVELDSRWFARRQIWPADLP